ncbi:MAG: ribonuclease P protein component [Candidatus Kerfeldbacteria bacterium]|nr:ribonuclease P protein component [Candidatus Kerfeldbacteria bacterium]
MLPRVHRLRRSSDFRRVYNRSLALSSSSLVFRVHRRSPKVSSRIGIVISAKISKKATVRNRLRRRLREALRAQLRGLPNGLDIIVTARPGSIGKSYANLNHQCVTIIRQLKDG